MIVSAVLIYVLLFAAAEFNPITQFMLRTSLFLFLCMVASNCNAEETDTVFLGRVIKNEHVDIKIPCPENSICMYSWFKWTLDVKRVISGSPLRGRVAAFRLQHADYTEKYKKRLKLFVIRPIKDAETKELLTAEYLLVEKSAEQKMACLDRQLSKTDLAKGQPYISSAPQPRVCFESKKLGKKKLSTQE